MLRRHLRGGANYAALPDRKERVRERQSTKVPKQRMHLCNGWAVDNDSYRAGAYRSVELMCPT